MRRKIAVIFVAMTVYNLPTDPRFNVLLTGDLDFVEEFAAILDAKSVPFSILPPMDEVDEMDMHLDLIDQDFQDATAQPEIYGPYADRVVYDIRTAAGSFTHIVDLSVGTPFERKIGLEVAGSINPKATIIASSLTNTATELGFLGNVVNRIVGIGLVPSMMSSVTIIEVAPGLNTTADHLGRAEALLTALGYTTERVEDRVGLVQLRVLVTIINEAAFAVMEGVASPEDIDKAMMLGTNYPKGPLAWADEIGLPVVTLILEGLYREYGQERYRPCVLLKQYMRAGWNGKAAGRGFHTYQA